MDGSTSVWAELSATVVPSFDAVDEPVGARQREQAPVESTDGALRLRHQRRQVARQLGRRVRWQGRRQEGVVEPLGCASCRPARWGAIRSRATSTPPARLGTMWSRDRFAPTWPGRHSTGS